MNTSQLRSTSAEKSPDSFLNKQLPTNYGLRSKLKSSRLSRGVSLDNLATKNLDNFHEEGYEDLQNGMVFFDEHKNFTQLCPKSKYVVDSKCQCCQTNLDTLFGKKKNICKFCGKSVCKECSKRRRPDPQNDDEFCRICDTCHFNYLYIRLQGRYQDKKKHRDQKLRHADTKYNQQKKELQKTQAIYDHFNTRLERSKTTYQSEINEYQAQIKRNEEMVQEIEKDNEDLNQKYKEINEQIRIIDEDLNQYKEQCDQLYKDLDYYTQTWEEKLQGIKNIQNMIEKTEQKISNDKQLKSNYQNNSSLLSNSKSLYRSSQLRNESHYQDSKLKISELTDSGIESMQSSFNNASRISQRIQQERNKKLYQSNIDSDSKKCCQIF